MPVTQTEILSAFTDATLYRHAVTGCPPEIFEIDRDFRGKSWLDIDAKTCNRHSDALLMLDAGPLMHFLPAFLVAALEQADSAAAESLAYFVWPVPSSTLRPHDFDAGFTVCQEGLFRHLAVGHQAGDLRYRADEERCGRIEFLPRGDHHHLG